MVGDMPKVQYKYAKKKLKKGSWQGIQNINDKIKQK